MMSTYDQGPARGTPAVLSRPRVLRPRMGGLVYTEMRRNLTFPIPEYHILLYLKSDRTVGSRFSVRSSPAPRPLAPFFAFIFPSGIVLDRAELPAR